LAAACTPGYSSQFLNHAAAFDLFWTTTSFAGDHLLLFLYNNNPLFLQASDALFQVGNPLVERGCGALLVLPKPDWDAGGDMERHGASYRAAE
jgi:hypothetical protein